jgi:hypothetical protein
VSSSSSGAPLGWAEAGYGYRVAITFDDGAGKEDLANFPVPILLGAGVVDFSHIQSAGQDIRFTDAGGAALPYEIERWDPAGATVWVLVPLIHASSTTDHVWLYYGNSTAKDAQMPGAVWANAYGAVYHLGDDLTASAPQVNDSTGRTPARGGTWHPANGAGSAAAKFATGLQLKGGAYVDLAEVSDFQAAASTDARTIEAWFQAQGSVAKPGYVVYGEGCCQGWSLGVWDDQNDPGAVNADMGFDNAGACCSAADGYHPVATTGQSYATGWHQAVLVVDRPGGKLELFVDGASQGSTPLTGTQSGDGAQFRIGTDWDDKQWFTGVVDEVRVSTVARTSGWIAAQYKAGTSGFTSFGPVQPY